jgi:hypothetical protein
LHSISSEFVFAVAQRSRSILVIIAKFDLDPKGNGIQLFLGFPSPLVRTECSYMVASSPGNEMHAERQRMLLRMLLLLWRHADNGIELPQIQVIAPLADQPGCC